MSSPRDQAGLVLLVVGYPGACWALARAVPMFRQRRARRFLATQAAIAAVALGWTLRGKAVPAVLNASMVVVLAAAWRIAGRRRS